MFKLNPTINSGFYSHKNCDQKNNKIMLLDGYKLPQVTFKMRSVDKPQNLMPRNVLKFYTESQKHDLENEQNNQFYQLRTNFHQETLLDNDDIKQNSKALHHISLTVETNLVRKSERLESVQKKERSQSIQVQKIVNGNKQIVVQKKRKDKIESHTNCQEFKHYSPLLSEQHLKKAYWILNKTLKFQHTQLGLPGIKLKKIFLCVLFLVIIEITYRKKYIIKLKLTIKTCQKMLSLYHEKYQVYQKKIFMQNIANKILNYIKRKDCFYEFKSVISMCGASLSKTNIINITRLFYQNLEIMTRENNFLKILQSELILHLFYNSNKTTTFFVGQRCNFYDKQLFSLPIDQKVVIGLEYFFFKFLLPYIFLLVREVELEFVKQNINVFSKFLTTPCLFHKQFVNKFQKLQKLKNPNGNMVYVNFNLQQLNKNQFTFEVNENNLNGNSNTLIEGLTDFAAFENLEKERVIWKGQMDFYLTKFAKILQSQ